MQDLEDVLKHVIINNPVDYVASNRQPIEETPQTDFVVQPAADLVLPRALDSLHLALGSLHLALDITQRTMAKLIRKSQQADQQTIFITKLQQDLD
jgi:hypothetical protein